MIFGNSIGARVKKVIAHRVKIAQKEYDESCLIFEQKRDNEIIDARIRCEEEKDGLATALVKRIIG